MPAATLATVASLEKILGSENPITLGSPVKITFFKGYMFAHGLGFSTMPFESSKIREMPQKAIFDNGKMGSFILHLPQLTEFQTD